MKQLLRFLGLPVGALLVITTLCVGAYAQTSEVSEPANNAAQQADTGTATTTTIPTTVTTTTSATDPRETQIVATLQRIADLRSNLVASNDALQNAQGEEEVAIMLQRQDRYKVLMTQLRQFGELTSAYTKGGGDLNNLLRDYRDDILNTGASLRDEVGKYTARLEKNNLTRDTLTVDGVKSYILDSRQLDMSYTLLSEYVDIVVTMSFDPVPSVNYLKAHLPARAEQLAGGIILSNQREAEYKKVLSVKADDTATQALLLLVKERLEADTTSLQLTVNLENKLGIDTKNHQTLLVKTTGDLNSNLLNVAVLKELFNDWWLGTKHDIRANTINFTFKFIVFLLIVIVFKVIASLVSRVIRRSVQSSRVRLSLLLQNMLISTVSRVILLMGVLVGLSQLGVSLGPVLAGLGVAGFVLGFALQDTLGNFAAGMMILVYRPYDEGDMVEAGGAFGKVKSMNIVSTTLLTIDNQTLIIPNSKIWGDVIKNVTAQAIRRVDMVFGIGYGDDIEKAEVILKDIVSTHEKVLAEPQAMIKLHKLGESSVDFIVRPWSRTDDYWDVYWDITRAVKMRFDAEGVSIPFPQRDVHIHQVQPKQTTA